MPKKLSLRNEAKGRECQIRIRGVCNSNPETTVLAHSNRKGMFGAGMGMKVPDIFGAWSCSACHDWVDGRGLGENMMCKADRDAYLNDGIFRTQKILLDEGKINV